MKLNNKGFTFVEILAVIAIIGILSGIAIVGVSKYRESAKNKDYEALAKSSYNAMEEYMMAHPYKKVASLETLDDGNFLSNRIDPATKNTNCEGSVEVNTVNGTDGAMDDSSYTVYLCCTNYKKQYTYPDGEVKDIDDLSKCDVSETDPDDYDIPSPLPGEVTYNITYNLNGGTVTGNPNKYSKSMLPFTIKNPTRSGYTFSGWTGSNGTTPQTTVTLPKGSKEDKTYTANWTQNTTPTPSTPTKIYKVTLNNNGATKAGTASVNVKVGDTKLSKITKPVKEVTIKYVNNVGATVTGGEKSKAYTLNGWYTTSSGGSKVATNAATPVLQKSVSGYTDKNGKWTKKSNTTLYAHWASVTATLPTITKTGYTCKWTTDNGAKSVASGGTWKFTSANSRTFTAVCTAKKIIVTFNCNGGSGGGTQTFTYGISNQKFSTTCTRTNYILDGWKLNKNASSINYSVASGVGNNWINTHSPRVTIYAHWLPPYVNQKGEQFTTLQAAIKDSDSKTIILQRNYTDNNSSNFNVNRRIVLDLNGKKLSLSKYAIVASKGTITIKNGIIQTSGTKSDTLSVSGGTVTINKDATILSKFKTSQEYGTSALRISGGTVILYGTIRSGLGVESGYARGAFIEGGTLNMYDGSTILSDARMPKPNGKGSSGINCTHKTINGEEVSKGTINIYGGTVKVTMGDNNRGVIAANFGRVRVKGNATLIWGGSMGKGAFLYSNQGTICYEKSVKISYNTSGNSLFESGNTSNITKKDSC